MTHKYIPNDRQKAIKNRSDGFVFGDWILGVSSGTTLNKQEEGGCCTGKGRYYDIEGNVSPLTNQKDNFTCAKLEVYKVIYS
jgi:hypothetical protein